MPRRYVVLHGFYGMGNIGDEAILAASLEALRRTTTLEPYVFAWNAEAVRAAFGVRALVPHRVRVARVLHVLLQSQALLLGGGGILRDYGDGPASLLRWLRPMALAQGLGVPTMTWSVGVEAVRYEASHAALRTVLGCADVVTVRDTDSARRLAALGIDRPVHVTADPVPALARAARALRRPHDGPPNLVVALRHWYVTRSQTEDPTVFERMLDAVAAACDALHERRGCAITFVPLRTRDGHDDDRRVAAEVARRMRAPVRRIEDPDPSVEATLRHLAEADVVLAMRLHAVVMATSLGIPTVAIAYAPKVEGYMADLGCAEACAPPQAITADWLIGRIEGALDQRDRLAVDLRARTDRMAEAFDANERLLATLLPPRHLRPPSHR